MLGNWSFVHTLVKASRYAQPQRALSGETKGDINKAKWIWGAWEMWVWNEKVQNNFSTFHVTCKSSELSSIWFISDGVARSLYFRAKRFSRASARIHVVSIGCIIYVVLSRSFFMFASKKCMWADREEKENNEIKFFSCSTLTDLFNDFSPTTSRFGRTTSSWRQSAAQLTVAAELKSENDGTGEESSSHGPHLTALIILNIHNERPLDMLSSSCAI